jgi:indole-3-glycerol phosphate synthase/phosphoribosylanthranilate isomerase
MQQLDEYPQYTPEQLKAALDSLLEGSSDPAFDGRHLFGYKDGVQDPNHELSKLQAITATRILDYERYLQSDDVVPESQLEQEMQSFWQNHGPLLNLQTVIQEQAPRMALAAEFKRASPSKGNIAVHLNAGEQAQQYAQAGANIISVLTEPRWFLGSLQDMTEVRLTTTQNSSSSSRPAVLRKEFTTSKYQITEALAKGADTILLIVAVLPQHLLKELIDHARSFGMEPLVEVHADAELEVAIQAGAKVIGVNNRNLHTFQMDLHTTEHVAEQLTAQGCTFDHADPVATKNSQYTLCALSGMSTAFDVDRYRSINVGMCLIGESLMRAADPKLAIAGLCLDPKDWEEMRSTVSGGAYTAGTKLVKVCGITNPDDALVACQAGANMIGVIFVPKSKRCVTAEQATAVVQAVRAFGERTNRETLSVKKPMDFTSPISQLISNAQALEAASRRPLVVGVFQNQSPEFIREMVDTCGLDLVQLHGSEGMEAANQEICGVPAIRVVDIATDPETGKACEDAVETILNSITTDPLAILLDTAIKGETAGGGTGVTFDHSIAEKIQNAGLPVIIAGGLTPENAPDAILTTRPWGVDVSSGVEATPGTKDHEKVKKFVEGVRTAAIEASKGF